jgi:hypothetical protein
VLFFSIYHKYININKIRDYIESGTMAKTETELNSKIVNLLKKSRGKKQMILEQLLMYATVGNAESYVIQLDFNYLTSQATQLSVLGPVAKKWSIPE